MPRRDEWRKRPHIAGRRPDVRNRSIEETIEEEFEAGIQMLAEDLVSEGWEPEAARVEARRRFGDSTRLREEAKAIVRSGDRRRGWRMYLGETLQDFSFGLRTLRQAPGFTFVAVLILAVGVGANVGVFSLLRGLVLRPMPYPEADRVVAIWETEIGSRGYQPLTGPDYFDLREQNETFADIGVYSFTWMNLQTGAEPERIRTVEATASMLRLLGMPPYSGRYFTEEEEQEGQDRVTVLGYGFWKERFDGDPGLLGSAITMNGATYQVIGILPPDFQFPSPWGYAEPVRMVIPVTLSRTEGRGSHWLAGIGRLADGVSARQAESDLKTIAARLRTEYPTTNGRVDLWVDDLMRRALGGVTGILVALLLIVGFVLVIGCANIASMMLARGAGRQTEMAIRASLGAGSRRILRQLLTESMVLALLGGVAGVALAYFSLGSLKALVPESVPRVDQIQIDGWVLFFSFLVMAGAGIAFGFAPALFTARSNLVSALSGGGGSRSGGRRRDRALFYLVVAQVALSIMLVNSAVMLFTSFRNVMTIPQGFDRDQVLVTSLRLTGDGYDSGKQRQAFLNRLMDRLRAIPGVSGSGVTTKLPTRGGSNGSILVEGDQYDPEAHRDLVEVSSVTPGYFEVMGIGRVLGRGFERSDIRPETGEQPEGVAIVNRALAERYWPGEDPLGKVFRNNGPETTWSYRVIGVVEDVRQWGLTYPALPERYLPLPVSWGSNYNIVVRSEGDPHSLAPAVRAAVREIDPALPVDGFITMGEIIRSQMSGRRLYTLLIALFMGIAVILAAAGTYGVMSYRVAQQTREIGVRMALGAARGQVIREYLREGSRLIALGAAFGVVAIIAGMSILSHMIYGLKPLQLLYQAGGILFLGLVVLAAITIPARRATRVDPMKALRTE